MPLILASASPRRAELLATAGIDFEAVAADVDEASLPGEAPQGYVLRVAGNKAAVIAAVGGVLTAVLAADTAVVVGAQLLGKPADAPDARAMLRLLSGRAHDVHTGVVLLTSTGQLAEVVTTRVRFVPLSDEDIDWYVSTGEPFGKAGGYAIQGQGSRFVDSIHGSWSNVVGLPVATVYRMLKQAGVIS